MDADVEEVQARAHAAWKALDESVLASGLAPKLTTLNVSEAAKGELKKMMSSSERRNEVVRGSIEIALYSTTWMNLRGLYREKKVWKLGQKNERYFSWPTWNIFSF